MALVVEDGTAKANAEAYDTVANANTYYDNMGYSDTATEATMRRGTQASAAMMMTWMKFVTTISMETASLMMCAVVIAMTSMIQTVVGICAARIRILLSMIRSIAMATLCWKWIVVTIIRLFLPWLPPRRRLIRLSLESDWLG